MATECRRGQPREPFKGEPDLPTQGYRVTAPFQGQLPGPHTAAQRSAAPTNPPQNPTTITPGLPKYDHACQP